MGESLQRSAAGDEQHGDQLQPAEHLQAAEAGEEHDHEHVRRHDHRPSGHAQEQEGLVFGPQCEALHNAHRGQGERLCRRLRLAGGIQRRRGRHAVVGDGQERRARLHSVHKGILEENHRLDYGRGAPVGEQCQRQWVWETHLVGRARQRTSQRDLHKNRHSNCTAPPRDGESCGDPEPVHIGQPGLVVAVHGSTRERHGRRARPKKKREAETT
mmetsp:Transcript_126368/g.365826  ORF Transcript_126368/g.365826 Transcript_126368/m.365826 type:complete len:214 (+) Transcript_126368:1015-1656(+)